MSKSATILGLVALASAGAPAYGSSAAAVYGSSSVVYSAEPSSAPVYAASSAGWSSEPVAYPSASSSWVAYPSSSFVYSAVASSSYPYYPASSSIVPSSTPTPVCWSKCFEEAGITSESQLCGNVEVDKCIHDGCCKDEAWAYWQWYDSYCPAPSSSYVIPYSTVPVGPASSSSYPATPTDNCWTDCFAEYDVTSEASLCGNDEVSKCIHDTCCAALDKAYWDWYNGYCAAATTTVVTITTVITPTVTPYSPITTTYEVTSGYGYTPVESSPATGYPVPPPAPAPYSSYPAPVSGAAVPTGYAAPSASAWAPVPATGAGAVTKPGVLLAAAMAFAAFF